MNGKVKPAPKSPVHLPIQLQGFNNLTKSLSFNIYDICYAQSETERQEYIEYIDDEYNAERLTQILTDVSHIIGANILNVARQNYDPQGASVTMLISEYPIDNPDLIETSPGPLNPLPVPPEKVIHNPSVVAHLDKSHLTVHTYPESHPDNGISTFRADIDVSTCGHISPLKALNYLIHSFDSDIVIMDYRIRGFTRDTRGMKHYIDHKINSIQDYIADDTKALYQMVDVNVYQENIFHTKMVLKNFELDNYLFACNTEDLAQTEQEEITKRLHQEMLEIFYARNMYSEIQPPAVQV